MSQNEKRDPYNGLSRRDYLDKICDDYDVDPKVVYSIANLLGPDEDFDGLIAMVQDFQYYSDGDVDPE